MDKQFWFDLRDNDYKIPEGYSLADLTEELFSYIPSADPELRDGIAYETFANWLDKDQYTLEQIRPYIPRLAINLQSGIGERDTDTIFGRAFSILFLAEIIYHDNKDPFLEKDDAQSILAKGLAYLNEERDPRGYIAEKGWAHALAHTADLLFVLSSNRFMARAELEQILTAITEKLTAPSDSIYAFGEDDRLVQAVLGAVQRKLLDEFFYKEWLKGFLFSEGRRRAWKGSFANPEMHHAYFNSRNFLRSLHLKILEKPKLASRDFLLSEIANTLNELKQF
ncbi:MAG: DUF2785 domain-containing protein [Anaerolineales bacterium]|nr:DUF2785 domain-containing protein [Anaerolineales bacterium]